MSDPEIPDEVTNQVLTQYVGVRHPRVIIDPGDLLRARMLTTYSGVTTSQDVLGGAATRLLIQEEASNSVNVRMFGPSEVHQAMHQDTSVVRTRLVLGGRATWTSGEYTGWDEGGTGSPFTVQDRGDPSIFAINTDASGSMELAGDLTLTGGGVIRTARSGWAAEMSSGEFPFRFFNQTGVAPSIVQAIDGSLYGAGAVQVTLPSNPVAGRFLVALCGFYGLGGTVPTNVTVSTANWSSTYVSAGVNFTRALCLTKVTDGPTDKVLTFTPVGGSDYSFYVYVAELDFGPSAQVNIDTPALFAASSTLHAPAAGTADAFQMVLALASADTASDVLSEQGAGSFVPTSDISLANFIGSPVNTVGSRYQNIDDGTVQSALDLANYLEAPLAVAETTATYRAGFTLPAGAVSSLTAYANAHLVSAVPTAQGVLRFRLFDGTNLVSTSDDHVIGTAAQWVLHTFDDLSIAPANVRVEVETVTFGTGSTAVDDFTNTAEGGADEELVAVDGANTGGDSGDPWTGYAATLPANIPVFDATTYGFETMAYRCDAQVAASASALEKTFSTPVATRYYRFSYRANTRPGTPSRFFRVQSGGAAVATVAWRGDSTHPDMVEIRDSQGTSWYGTVPIRPDLGTYVFEVKVTVGNPGAVEVRVYQYGVLVDTVVAVSPDTSGAGALTTQNLWRIGAHTTNFGDPYIAWVDVASSGTEGWLGYPTEYPVQARLNALYITAQQATSALWTEQGEEAVDHAGPAWAHFNVFTRIPGVAEPLDIDVQATPGWVLSTLGIGFAASEQTFWVDDEGRVFANRLVASTRSAEAAIQVRPQDVTANVFEGYSAAGGLTAAISQQGVVTLTGISGSPAAPGPSQTSLYTKMLGYDHELFVRRTATEAALPLTRAVWRSASPLVTGRLAVSGDQGVEDLVGVYSRVRSFTDPAEVGESYFGSVTGMMDNVAPSGTLTLRFWVTQSGADILLCSLVVPSQANAKTSSGFWLDYAVTTVTVDPSGGIVAASMRLREEMSGTTTAVSARPTNIETDRDGGFTGTITAQWTTANAGNILYVDQATVNRYS